jgi:hypothetical protein
VGGRIATVGARLVDSAARSIIRQSLEGLNEYLKVQVAAQAVEAPVSSPDETDETTETSADSDAVKPIPAAEAAPETPVPTYKPPTQTQVALNVARDMFNDMVPAERRPMVAAGAIGLIVVILWLIIR